MNSRRTSAIARAASSLESGMRGDARRMMMMYSVTARLDDERRRRRGAESHDLGVE